MLEVATATSVLVNRATLDRAMQLCGFEDPSEAVEFALRLLTAPDPSADFARVTRGSLPDLELEV